MSIVGVIQLIVAAFGVYTLNTDKWVLVMAGHIDPRTELSKADRETFDTIMKYMKEYGFDYGAQGGIEALTAFMSPAYSFLNFIALLPFLIICGVICCGAFYAGYEQTKTKEEEN